MTSTKYIGMDVHKESISIAVRNSAGKVVMESVIETKTSMILQFINGLRGDLQATFEEGTSAAWLYDLLKPHVSKLVVCDPRKNKSMREGNQNDKIDARRLAELLRLDHLTPVYHGEHAWAMPRSRAYSAAGQNRSCSNQWAEKQEKLQPLEWCFLLTSPLIELTENAVYRDLADVVYHFRSGRGASWTGLKRSERGLCPRTPRI